jgi:hypothetical protein
VFAIRKIYCKKHAKKANLASCPGDAGTPLNKEKGCRGRLMDIVLTDATFRDFVTFAGNTENQPKSRHRSLRNPPALIRPHLFSLVATGPEKLEAQVWRGPGDSVETLL